MAANQIVVKEELMMKDFVNLSHTSSSTIRIRSDRLLDRRRQKEAAVVDYLEFREW
jgi:hypothetical protein